MLFEKRTRVEIFLPIRLETASYRTVTEWLSEELAFSRGGSTLTTPFTGLFLSLTEKNLTRDQIPLFPFDEYPPEFWNWLASRLGFYLMLKARK